MSSPHYVAIETYGSQRVTFAGQSIGAYKIGYSTVSKAVLLNLYGSTARDVTSKHASYHYVQLTGATCVHQGYLVLALNETEFAQVQQLTRSHPTRRSGIWYWQERQWRHFPYAESAEFTLPLGRGGPTFDPTRLRVVSHSQNAPVEVDESIHAEYMQRSPTEDGWWWLSGNTYPHRELLKQQGLRWSAKRSAWYFIGKTLPPAVQALLTATSEPAPLEDDAPCSDAEAERILGVKLAPKPETPPIKALLPPEHRFTLGQTVYLATSLRIAKDKKLRMDTQGMVIRRYVFQKTADYRHQFAYGVDFGEHGIVTLFQDSLADAPYDIPGIERHETIPIMFGVSAEQGILAEVERRQRIPQEYTVLDELRIEVSPPAMNPAYTPGQTVFIQTGRGLPTEMVTIRQAYPPCLNAHQKRETGYRVQGGAGEYTVFESELTAEPPKPSIEVQLLESPAERHRSAAYWEQVRAVRERIGHDELPLPTPKLPSSAVLLPPEPLPAELPPPPEPSLATPPPDIANTLPTLTTPKKPKIEPQYHPTPRFTPTQTYTLPQTYIGQIGSAVGTVFAFGAATWEHQPVYLDLAGGNAAVQSVWARLADGQSVHIVPLETGGANILLQPRAKGSLKPLRKKLALGLDHLLLLHHDFVEPIYGETSATYLIELDETQRVAKLAAHITHLVQIAVFESYHAYLWDAGQTAKLLRRCTCHGNVQLWHLQLDQSAWTNLLCEGLKSGQLELPKGET